MSEPTRLEMALAAMFSAYMSYQGDDNKLTKEQFLKLVENELPLLSKGIDNDEFFKFVDHNDDNRVDFDEFASLVAGCACASHDTLQEVMKELEKRDCPK